MGRFVFNVESTFSANIIMYVPEHGRGNTGRPVGPNIQCVKICFKVLLNNKGAVSHICGLQLLLPFFVWAMTDCGRSSQLYVASTCTAGPIK